MSDWPRRRVGDLADWRGGMTPSLANAAFWEGGDIPWISSSEVIGGVLTDTERKVTAQALRETSLRLVPASSVAIVVRSGILLHKFPVALVPFDTTVNQDVKIGVPCDEVLPEFLAYSLDSHSDAILQRCRKTGTTVQSIDVPTLMSLKLPVPPLTEQRRIVDLLTAWGKHIDALISERLTIRALARALPVPAERVPTRPLGASVRARGGKRMPKGTAFAGEVTEHAYLRVIDMHEGDFLRDQLEYVPEHVWPKIRQYTVHAKDLVISIVGTIGRVALVPDWAAGANLTENAAIIDLLDDSLDRVWLACWLASEAGQREVQRVTVGTSQGKLALSRIPLIEVPEITLAEQQRLGTAAAEAQRLAGFVSTEIADLRLARQRVASELLRGGLEVPESYEAILGGAV